MKFTSGKSSSRTCLCEALGPILTWCRLSGNLPLTTTHDLNGKCNFRLSFKWRLCSFFMLAVSFVPIVRIKYLFTLIRYENYFLSCIVVYTFGSLSFIFVVYSLANHAQLTAYFNQLSAVFNTDLVCESSKRKIKAQSLVFCTTTAGGCFFFAILLYISVNDDEWLDEIYICVFYLHNLMSFCILVLMSVLLVTNIFSCFITDLTMEINMPDSDVVDLKGTFFSTATAVCESKHQCVLRVMSHINLAKYDVYRIVHEMFCDIASGLSSCFGAHVLSLFVFVLLGFIAEVFFVIYMLTADSIVVNLVLFGLTVLIIQLIICTFLLEAVSLCLRQSNASVSVVLSCSQTLENHQIIKIFMDKVRMAPVSVTAGNIITLNSHMSLPLLDSITTYALVGYSFEIFKKS